MSNPGMRLTRAGRNILANGLLGEEIHFTKVAFGDGDFDYDTENVMDLTDLKSWKMDLPIVDKQINGDGAAIIVALCSNAELEKGFRAKEIGVFATDQETGEPILYAYRNAGDEYNFIPAKSGVVTKNMRYAYMIEIGDAENVTFDINFSFVYVGKDEFDRLKGRFKDLWFDKLIPSARDIAEIIDDKFVPSGEDGEGELNGVPTAQDIEDIINGTYEHREVETDEYGFTEDDVPTEEEIEEIGNRI